MINSALNINIVGEAGKGDKVIAKAGDIQQDIGWGRHLRNWAGTVANHYFYFNIRQVFKKTITFSIYLVQPSNCQTKKIESKAKHCVIHQAANPSLQWLRSF